MSDTYAGSTLSLVASVPATYDETGYVALTFVTGSCALWSAPRIARKWDPVSEDLVCGGGGSYDKKGGYKYDIVNFKLSQLPADAAQVIYRSLENSTTIGSFKYALPGSSGTIYFTAQVTLFALADGGDKNTIHTGDIELLIQSDPVFVAAA